MAFRAITRHNIRTQNSEIEHLTYLPLLFLLGRWIGWAVGQFPTGVRLSTIVNRSPTSQLKYLQNFSMMSPSNLVVSPLSQLYMVCLGTPVSLARVTTLMTRFSRVCFSPIKAANRICTGILPISLSIASYNIQNGLSRMFVLGYKITEFSPTFLT